MRFRHFGKGAKRKQPGEMTKAEAEYAAHLEEQKQAGEILDWKYESQKFRLAKRTWLTPDFQVLAADGVLEQREFKSGPWMDDAKVKFKVAAEQHWWYRWVMVTTNRKRDGGGWKTEIYESG